MYRLDITPSERPHTKYGNTRLNRDGYVIISSKKEGNHDKMLHRLIWEEYFGELPKGVHIHHLDHNRQNNCIWNLEPINASEHLRMHQSGRTFSKEHCYAISKGQNTTGYYRVHKENNKGCKQGFTYVYQYYENGKPKYIKRVNLMDLQEEVEQKGLKWSKIEDLR